MNTWTQPLVGQEGGRGKGRDLVGGDGVQLGLLVRGAPDGDLAAGAAHHEQARLPVQPDALDAVAGVVAEGVEAADLGSFLA